MEEKLYLSEILPIDSIFKNKKVKLVRHFDSKFKIENEKESFFKFVKLGFLDEYQMYQGKHIFKCDYIVSLYGETGSKAVFYGIYQVLDVFKPAPQISNEMKEIFPGFIVNGNTFFYRLKELPEYRKYRHRLVIKWGEGPAIRMWHQWYDKNKDKEIVEVRAQNYIGDFPGLMNLQLDFFDLNEMIKNPESNRVWYDQLSNIKAVYAILNKNDGKVYIGSAYGEKGLWGRWSEYARTKTGNNALLIELIKTDPESYKQFQFSILEVLPKTARKDDVIAVESLYKEKLGSRFFGLNAN